MVRWECFLPRPPFTFGAREDLCESVYAFGVRQYSRTTKFQVVRRLAWAAVDPRQRRTIKQSFPHRFVAQQRGSQRSCLLRQLAEHGLYLVAQDMACERTHGGADPLCLIGDVADLIPNSGDIPR